MGRKKGNRSDSQKERDRREISRRYLKGELQWDIANALNIDQAIVSRELKIIQKQWQKDSIFDFNEAKQKELAKIDNLELEYWDSWQTSKAERAAGDPRFLNGVQWCITKRCEILGFDAPTKLEHTGKDGGAIESKITIEIIDPVDYED